jgi:alkylated DNA repair dioxygenase AlkB
VALPHGSLCIMYPPTNEHWAHSIETEQETRAPRISLVFRHTPVL